MVDELLLKHRGCSRRWYVMGIEDGKVSEVSMKGSVVVPKPLYNGNGFGNRGNLWIGRGGGSSIQNKASHST